MAQKQFEILHENDDPVKRRRQKRKERDFQKQWELFLKKIIPTKEDKDKMLKGIDRFIELAEEKAVRLDLDSLNYK